MHRNVRPVPAQNDILLHTFNTLIFVTLFSKFKICKNCSPEATHTHSYRTHSNSSFCRVFQGYQYHTLQGNDVIILEKCSVGSAKI
jgi:hypothetical protein